MMFDRLFTRPAARARHRDGPLAQERLAYLTHLTGLGASLKTLRVASHTLLTVAAHLRLADRPADSIRPDEIERAAARWAARRSPIPQRRPGLCSGPTFVAHANGWLRFLGRLVEPSLAPGPFAAMIAAFAEHMRAERGFSSHTVRGRCWILRRFLGRLGATTGELHGLTIARLDELFLELIGPGGYSRTSARHYAGSLRAFFRFAETRGWCRAGLAVAIQAPRVYSQTSVPAGPSWDDVKRLLAATEGDRPADIRDRAILLLLAVYGLRAGDVTRLRLDDLDWERERLTVTGPKNGRARTSPLTRPVGDAILRYLRETRPATTRREVFLSLAAPVRPLGHLWHVVGPRLRRLGVSLPRHGPHALRHACATHLLAQGLSLTAIGDHLGHCDPDATRIYAKVDLAGLRRVADLDLGGLQ